MGSKLLKYVKNNYKNSNADLCTIFIERCLEYSKNTRYIALITMHSWMFLGSYSNLRKKIIDNISISSLVNL